MARISFAPLCLLSIIPQSHGLHPSTSAQLSSILPHLPPEPSADPSGILDAPAAEALLSSHPTVDSSPQDADGVVALAFKNPNALKWPTMVEWNNGRAAVDDVSGVK